mgnify:CR=1 FL=1
MELLNGMDKLQELECGESFVYILKDADQFQMTGYKVLQSQTGENLIPCMKIQYNGQIALYYNTETYRPLSTVGNILDESYFLSVLRSFVHAMDAVKNNGFLSCQNLVITPQKIYVDANTYQVKLIYIPLLQKNYKSEEDLQMAVKNCLQVVTDQRGAAQSNLMQQVISQLEDMSFTVEKLKNVLYGEKNSSSSKEKRAENLMQKSAPKVLTLISMNTPERVELRITKDEFIIGKKQGVVDGMLTFSRMISRIHCKIIRQGNDYYIMDLRSSNGTFVNGRKIHPEEKVILHNGDVVKIATSSFQAIMR